MSRTRVRAEDLFCARCHRAVRLGTAHWPEDYLCAACYDHGLETYGICVICGAERLTPGLAPDGGKLCADCADCADCAGGLGDFTCEQCGREARRYWRGICGQCVLAERLHELLDSGTGSIRAPGRARWRGRTGAIRHLVLQAPAPVVARMLGYHDDTTAELAAEAGGTRRHYAPGDHSR
ncbi:hypothetical protein [Streptomyces sp. NPDC094472]|uniref:hypothetical protein n=1 Tax=unclassified Streptomyces TaxID=2593676 RepID=UPI00331F6F39